MKKNLAFIFMICIVLIYISPFIPLVLSSFAKNWRFPMPIPEEFSLRAWRYIFFDTKTKIAIFNTVFISFFLLIINIIVSIPAANVLARYKFRGKNIIEVIIFAPIIVPPFISVMGIHFNFIKLGLTENIIGVIAVHIIPTMPYMIRALIISYKTLSFDMENVAKSLGANILKRYYYVVIPHLIPALIAGSSLTILISFSQYISTLIIGGGDIITLSLLIFPFISGGDIVIGSAYVVLFTLVNLLALFIMEKVLKSFYSNGINLNI